MTDTIRLLIDGAAGVHVPNRFYKNFDLAQWGIEPEEYLELADADSDTYWDAWDDLLSSAEFTD